MTTVQHKRLKEEPSPLSIINPVYDDNLAGIELQDKGDGANNNLTTTDKGATDELSGDVKVTIVPETSANPASDSSVENPSNGTTKNSSNGNGASHYQWHKGTEKLIQHGSLTFGQRSCSKRTALMLIIAVVVLLVIVVTLAAYFLYAYFHKLPVSSHSSATTSHLKQGNDILAIRLSDDYRGFLEVKYNGLWLPVCSSTWSHNEANVVCRYLQHSGVSSTESVKANSQTLKSSIPLANVQCSGKEASLDQCEGKITFDKSDKCVGNTTVWIRCVTKGDSTTSPTANATEKIVPSPATAMGTNATSTLEPAADNTTARERPDSTPVTSDPSTPSTSDTAPSSTATLPTTTTVQPISANASIQLIDGATPNKGLLVLTMDGENYTICDDRWTKENSHVACRMAGYPEVTLWKDVHMQDAENNEFNANAFLIYPNRITCNGSEAKLSDCRFEVSEIGCFHNDDMITVCGPEPTSPPTTLGPSPAAPNTTSSATTVTTSTTTSAPTTTASTTTITIPPPPAMDTSRPIKERAMVRLKGGMGEYVGRLEIKINDTWGTVCDDGWKAENAKVVCTQLDYMDFDDYRRLTERNGVVRGETDQTIWLKDVQCSGSEEYLTACEHKLAEDCNHNEDVMMSCKQNGTTPKVHFNGDLRLNPGPHIGRLESYFQGQWGGVCDEGWDEQDAVVACRQLGYANLTAHSVQSYTEPDESIEYLLSEIHCTGNETKLDRCVQNRPNENSCKDSSWWYTYNNKIAISCDEDSKFNSTDPRDHIRLVNGLEDINKGMLQYRVDGQWGSLCKEEWNNRSANLACHQLGFPGVLEYNISITSINSIPDAAFAVPFHGKHYTCNVLDMEIEDCVMFAPTGCQHRQDEVAITCVPRPGQLPLNFTADPTIRVVHGPSKFEGVVEVYINENWGRACDQGDWTHTQMGLVCFNLFSKQHFTGLIEKSEVEAGTYIAGNFNCTNFVGDASHPPSSFHFTDCGYNSSSTYLSQCHEEAWVKCL